MALGGSQVKTLKQNNLKDIKTIKTSTKYKYRQQLS